MKTRKAFTLVEMVASLAILAILLLACASILTLANYTTGASAGRLATQFQAADVADQVVDDLNVATNFTERTPTAVTFTVPDRLGTGSPQAVRYAWGGTVGAPLTRQFNGGTAVPIANSVQSFNLGYLLRTMGSNPATEQTLFQYGIGLLPSYHDYVIDANHCAAQYFLPNVPLGTNSYSISRVGLVLKAAGPADAFMTLKVVAADAFNRPTGAVLGTATVYETAFGTNYELVSVPFSNLSNLNPLQGLCIVVQYGAGGPQAGNWQYESSLTSILSGSYWSTSSNAGSTWTVGSSLSAGEMVVYGTIP